MGSTGILIAGACLLIQDSSKNEGNYKDFIQHYCVPVDRIVADAKADWEYYEKRIRDNGMVPADVPYVPYLYTQEYVEEQLQIHKEEITKKFNLENEGLPDHQEVKLVCAASQESVIFPARFQMVVMELKELLCKHCGLSSSDSLVFINTRQNNHIMDNLAFTVPEILVKGV